MLARDRAGFETHVLDRSSWVEHLTRRRHDARDLSTSFGNGTGRKRRAGACTLLGPEGPDGASFVSTEGAHANLRTFS